MKAAASVLNRLLILGGVLVLGLIIVSLFVWNGEAEKIPDAGSSTSPVDPPGPVIIADNTEAAGSFSSGVNTLASKSNAESSKPDSSSAIKPNGDKESTANAGGERESVHDVPDSKPHSKTGKGSSVTRTASGSYIISLIDTPEAGGKSGGKKSSQSTGKSGSQSASKAEGTLTKSISKSVSIAVRGAMSTVSGTSNVSADGGNESDTESPDILPLSTNRNLQMPTLTLEPLSIKRFRFSWADIGGETEYRLLEKTGESAGYKQIAALPADAVSHELQVFLPRRINARYILQACNAEGCANSEPARVSGTLAEAVGYVKASNAGSEDRFGHAVAVSGDGNTLAVGAPWEDGTGNGIDGDQNNGTVVNSGVNSGAVYIFIRNGGNWSQQAYVKSSSAETGEEFGWSVALSDDGNTLAVGAEHGGSDVPVNGRRNGRPGVVYVFVRKAGAWSQQDSVNAFSPEPFDSFGVSVALSGNGNTLAVGACGDDSNATGINGEQNNGLGENSGAVYVFTRGSGGSWTRQAYVKASNTEAGDHFGQSVSLSNDGNTLAVGANLEDSAATGVNGDQDDNTAISGGAVYVFIRSGGNWAQQAYVKASNTRPGDLLTADEFGMSVALSGAGNTLAVGARFEDSVSTGINGSEDAGSKHSSGAVYIFTRGGGSWMQQAYVKASNTEWGDEFGVSVALSGNGNTLAVGASGEDSNATGINGNQDNNMFQSPGAAYVFTRRGGNWFQQAYVKACNTAQIPRDPKHAFGFSVSLSESGDALGIGAPEEDGGISGVTRCQNDSFSRASGAVYLY